LGTILSKFGKSSIRESSVMSERCCEQFDGSDLSRYALNLPITPNASFESVFVRRGSRRFLHSRYAAYTKDMETLVLAGESHSDRYSTVVISRDSTRFDRQTRDYMGALKTVSFRQYASFSWHPQVDGSQREMILVKRTEVVTNAERSAIDSVGIPKIGHQILVKPSKYDRLDFENMLLINVTQEESPSDAHVGKFEGKVCFRMSAIAPNEFALTVGHPLSFFQGFALAVVRLL
jgi:hypothetical protein